jgi:ABC-2 type transport system permease protein
MGTPFFWLFFMGNGLKNEFPCAGVDYTAFITPGIILLNILFTGVFSGVSVITDRQFGFLKEMLVAPVSRTTIVVGRVLGNATTAVAQGLLVLLISMFLLGTQVNVAGIPVALLLMAIVACALVAVGISFACKISDTQAFQFIVNFFIFPLFFLSGALFPLDNAPGWLHTASSLNPLTYAVDGMRSVLLGKSIFPLWMDFAVLTAFMLVMVALASWLFGQKE